jgi:hypothetical protein
VRGRVDGGSADWDDDDVVVVVVVLDEPAEVALPDDEVVAGAVDELEELELGAEGWVLVEPELLLEPECPPEPDEPEPPSGSTYCWSPADPPPPASAAAGASIARAAIATTRPKICQRRLTRRVLHRVVREVADPARRRLT